MDKEKFDQFASLEDLSSLAKLLGFRKGTLAYIFYGRDRDLQYKAFKLSKKNGGERQIEAPITALKTVQWRLCRILEDVYWRRPSAFGFVKGHSIKDNAKRHCNKKYVFNLDLKNFFHSIHFGRVRGLFASQPFSLPLGVATIIAQICCYKGRLPQGAPTSPVISNMICTKLDRDLQNLAKSCRSHYTRYADDITFSMNDVTNVGKIWEYENEPFNIFRTLKKLIIGKDQKAERNVVVGKELNDIIVANGFVINSKKVRLASYKERQEVTGLVVNKFPNVRRDYIRLTRAILHSWKTYGLEKASEKFFNDEYVWNGKGERPPFESIVRGRIEYVGMIRGKDDPVYLKQLREFFYISQGKIPEKSESRFRQPLDDKRKYVITEGKTDWKHIRAAITDLCNSGVVKSFEPYLYEYEEGEPAGDVNMLERCKALGKTNSGEKRIFVFDNDNSQIVSKATEKGKAYKHWGNVFIQLYYPYLNLGSTMKCQ